MSTLIKRHHWGLALAIALGLLFALLPEAYASVLPLPDAGELDLIAPEGDNAVEKADSLLGPLARSARIIIGAVAVLLMVIAGFTMVISADNEEKVKEQRKVLTYAILGLILISIGGPLAEIFDFRQGNFIADDASLLQRAQLFDDTTRIVITFLKYALGSLATLFAIRSGAIMISSGAEEEEISREKKNLGMAAGGLLLVIFSDLIVRQMFYNTRFNSTTSETVVSINQNEIITQIVSITNFVVTFISPIMVLSLVVGGVLLITAGGNEERVELAKKIIINSVIGLVVVYGAFGLVSTLILGVF